MSNMSDICRYVGRGFKALDPRDLATEFTTSARTYREAPRGGKLEGAKLYATVAKIVRPYFKLLMLAAITVTVISAFVCVMKPFLISAAVLTAFFALSTIAATYFAYPMYFNKGMQARVITKGQHALDAANNWIE